MTILPIFIAVGTVAVAWIFTRDLEEDECDYPYCWCEDSCSKEDNGS